jgi:hypothetical protein
MAHGDHLECLAKQGDLAPVVRSESADDQLPARPDLEQSFLQQKAECMADRRARGAKGSGEISLG